MYPEPPLIKYLLITGLKTEFHTSSPFHPSTLLRVYTVTQAAVPTPTVWRKNRNRVNMKQKREQMFCQPPHAEQTAIISKRGSILIIILITETASSQPAGVGEVCRPEPCPAMLSMAGSSRLAVSRVYGSFSCS